MVSPVPIQNIYYLLCYAWNRLEEKDTVDVSSLEGTELADLFAKVLITGTHHLMRRGFDRGYLQFDENSRRPRGKIDISSTLKSSLFLRGKVRCTFDELDYNVLHNRVLITTITNLSVVTNLTREHKEGLHEIAKRLWEVNTLKLSAQHFHRIQLHRNNHYYGFLLNVCELVYENLLVNEETGEVRFRDFTRDERKMSKLFEGFVRNFYALEQRDFEVKRLRICWDAVGEGRSMDFLPRMETDVCLTSKSRRIILECKFYKDTLQLHFAKPTLHSSHLYQLFAYLKNQEVQPAWKESEGILLYPTVNDPVTLNYKLGKHPVRIRTINLNQDWQTIHEDMLALIAA